MDERLLVRKMLNEEINLRKSRNPQYSLRAFARDLGVSPSTISEILNGHHLPSTNRALTIVARLAWEDEQRQKFLDAVSVLAARRPAVRSRASHKFKLCKSDLDSVLQSLEQMNSDAPSHDYLVEVRVQQQN